MKVDSALFTCSFAEPLRHKMESRGRLLMQIAFCKPSRCILFLVMGWQASHLRWNSLTLEDLTPYDCELVEGILTCYFVFICVPHHVMKKMAQRRVHDLSETGLRNAGLYRKLMTCGNYRLGAKLRWMRWIKLGASVWRCNTAKKQNNLSTPGL